MIGDRQEPEHSQKIDAILKAGINSFVCLQERSELTKRFTPYMNIARSLSAEAARVGTANEEGNLEFFHGPIPDKSVCTDDEIETVMATIVDRLMAKRVVYVHSGGAMAGRAEGGRTKGGRNKGGGGLGAG